MTGSSKNKLNSYDIHSILIYVGANVISILVPLGISYVNKLNLPAEAITAMVFVLNTVLIILKKYKQDNSNIEIKEKK